MILDHPITHANQQFICPSDAAVNDDVGQVTRGLVTHADFFFQRWGITLLDSDYKCTIQSGNTDGAFALDINTGDLTIPIPSNFTATRNLVIRVYPQQYPWYYMDTTCEILYIPAADCIYFDVDFVGTSDGSRSAPYTKYSANVYGGAAWGLTSIPGKTFLWRRGKTWTNEWTVTNTGTNEATLPIRFGAWGQGVRPIIDLSLNSTSERFAQVGLASMSGPAEDFKMSNNIYYYDFDITHDNSNDAYPVQVVPMGRFIEFHRMKMTNCTFPEGFMWFAGPFAYPYVDRNILIRDIFTYNHGIDTVGGGANDWPRAIKMETGGSTAENIYCETSKNYHSAAFSGGATRQNVTTKYVKAKINVSLSGELFGMEVRNVSQHHQWVVLDGVDYGLTIFGFKGQISGEEVVPDSTSGFSDVILKNIGVLDVTTINQTVLDMDGVYIKNVISEESSGVLIGGSTKCINTKLQNLLLTNSVTLSDAEIQVGSSGFQNQNGATIIENCLCGRIDNYDNQTIVRNTIYETIVETQTAVITTSLTPISAGDYKNANYEPTVSAAQLGAGTADAGLVIDLNGDLRPSPPAIGPYEYTNENLETYAITFVIDPIGGGTATQDPDQEHRFEDNIELQATPNSGYTFNGWYDGVSLISSLNPYTYSMPQSDETITAKFDLIGNVLTLSIDPSGAGSAEQSPASPHETGTSVTLTATANPSYLFLGWYDGVTLLSASNPYIYTTGGTDKTITAKFEINLSGPFIKKGKWSTKII